MSTTGILAGFGILAVVALALLVVLTLYRQRLTTYFTMRTAERRPDLVVQILQEHEDEQANLGGAPADPSTTPPIAEHPKKNGGPIGHATGAQ
jgi:hypothetical protein